MFLTKIQIIYECTLYFQFSLMNGLNQTFPFASFLICKSEQISPLIKVCKVIVKVKNCGLVTPYGDRDLGQVMACFLMAPSHYLNQCWLIISDVQWHSYQDKHQSLKSVLNYISTISSKFPRGQWVKVNKFMRCPICYINMLRWLKIKCHS